MPKQEKPCFYTDMINKLENLDLKVHEIQKSIRLVKAMLNERVEVPLNTDNASPTKDKESE
jgi:hypothetical protein